MGREALGPAARRVAQPTGLPVGWHCRADGSMGGQWPPQRSRLSACLVVDGLLAAPDALGIVVRPRGWGRLHALLLLGQEGVAGRQRGGESAGKMGAAERAGGTTGRGQQGLAGRCRKLARSWLPVQVAPFSTHTDPHPPSHKVRHSPVRQPCLSFRPCCRRGGPWRRRRR